MPPTTVQFVKAGAGWHISYLSQEVTGGVFRVGEEAMQTSHSNPGQMVASHLGAPYPITLRFVGLAQTKPNQEEESGKT